MKKIINISIIIIALFCSTFMLKSCGAGDITRSEFQAAILGLDNKIDSLQLDLSFVKESVDKIDLRTERMELKTDTINSNIKDIQANIEKLREGQNIIYNEVKKTNVSFWDLF